MIRKLEPSCKLQFYAGSYRCGCNIEQKTQGTEMAVLGILKKTKLRFKENIADCSILILGNCKNEMYEFLVFSRLFPSRDSN